MNKPYLIIFLFLLFLARLMAQPVDTATLAINNLVGHFRAAGALRDNWLWRKATPGQPARCLSKNAGLWWSGVTSGGDFVTTDLTGRHNHAGWVRGADTLRGIWRVTAAEVNAHLADYLDNFQIDNPLPAIFGWPAQHNPFFAAYNGGMQLPDNHRGLTLFWDMNFNGRYEPQLGDYPLITERQIYSLPNDQWIPDEMIWIPFRGLWKEGVAASLYPEVEGSLLAFAFRCDDDLNPINNMLMVAYNLYPLDEEGVDIFDLALPFYADLDAGCPDDDYLAFLSRYEFLDGRNHPMMCVYNSGQSLAAGCEPDQELPGPVVGVFLKNRPWSYQPQATDDVSVTMPIYAPGENVAATTYPDTSADYFRLSRGRWKDNTELRAGGAGYGGDFAPTTLAFPDQPSNGQGWSEWVAQNPPGDRAGLMAGSLLNLGYPIVLQTFAVFVEHQPAPGTPIPLAIDSLKTLAYRLESTFLLHIYERSLLCGQLTPTQLPATRPAVEIRVRPNPVYHWAELRSAEPLSGQLTLLDLAGRPLAHWTLAQYTTFSLDLHAWPAGVYLLRYQGHNGATGMQRLVVGR